MLVALRLPAASGSAAKPFPKPAVVHASALGATIVLEEFECSLCFSAWPFPWSSQFSVIRALAPL
jgi:hypothetical protein